MKSKTTFGALKLCASKKVFTLVLIWNSLALYANPNIAHQNIYIDAAVKDAASLKDAVSTDDDSTIHLLSHGKPGELFIDEQWLQKEAIVDFLTSNSLILNIEVQKSNILQLNIYASNFAKGKKGQEAVKYIEQQLEISVAASNNLTGKDGDWILETGNSINTIQPLNYPYNLHIASPIDKNSPMDRLKKLIEVTELTDVNFKIFANEICVNAGLHTGLGGGTPYGGVYSGPAVIDDGNGKTYSFDPLLAGPGVASITYTFTNGVNSSRSDSDSILVKPIPKSVNFTAPDDLSINAGVQTGLNGGLPVEGSEISDDGVYFGPGVTDNNDGTYDFNPLAAGVGSHLIVYAYTEDDSEGLNCVALASDIITVSPESNEGDNGSIEIYVINSIDEDKLFLKLGDNPEKGGVWSDAVGRPVVFPIKTSGVYTYTINRTGSSSTEKYTATITLKIKKSDMAFKDN